MSLDAYKHTNVLNSTWLICIKMISLNNVTVKLTFNSLKTVFFCFKISRNLYALYSHAVVSSRFTFMKLECTTYNMTFNYILYVYYLTLEKSRKIHIICFYSVLSITESFRIKLFGGTAISFRYKSGLTITV